MKLNLFTMGLGLMLLLSCATKQLEKLENTETSVDSDREKIMAVVQNNAKDVRRCYERKGLRSDPKLEGSVKVGLTVLDTGKASNIRVISSTLNSRDVENCIVEKVASWDFPAPPKGASVTIDGLFNLVIRN